MTSECGRALFPSKAESCPRLVDSHVSSLGSSGNKKLAIKQASLGAFAIASCLRQEPQSDISLCRMGINCCAARAGAALRQRNREIALRSWISALSLRLAACTSGGAGREGTISPAPSPLAFNLDTRRAIIDQYGDFTGGKTKPSGTGVGARHAVRRSSPTPPFGTRRCVAV